MPVAVPNVASVPDFAFIPAPSTLHSKEKLLPLPVLPDRSGRLIELPSGVVPASRLEVRAPAATAPTGISEIDALTGGLPRGALTEIFGPASSGRTSLLLSALAQATHRQEICALVDASDAFHPEFAAAAGVDLTRLLWVRCEEQFRVSSFKFQNPSPHRNLQLETRNSSPKPETRNSKLWSKRLEQVLKSTDLLLQSSGFGLVIVDLADVPPQSARRVPLTSWFRFRRAVENTPTVLLVVEQEPYAKTCASLVLKMQPTALMQQSAVSIQHSVNAEICPSHTQILRGLPVRVEVVHARTQRKPVRSATAAFETRAAWAG
jgi:recombination protein RecA